MKNSPSQRLYSVVEKIPRGKVSTYKDTALKAGIKNPRLAGRLLSQNPHMVSLPCHRVVKSDGTVGGYSGPGGKDAKISLLKSEGIEFEGESIKEFRKRVAK